MILGFHLKVDETSLQTFPGHPIGLLKVVGCPKTVVKIATTALQNFPEESRCLIMNAPILSFKRVVTTQMFAKNRRYQ
jgi:hypothetical protein